MKAEKNLFKILETLSPAEQSVCRANPEYFIRRWVASPEDQVEVTKEPWSPHPADRLTPPGVISRILFKITQPNGYSRTYHFGITL